MYTNVCGCLLATNTSADDNYNYNISISHYKIRHLCNYLMTLSISRHNERLLKRTHHYQLPSLAPDVPNSSVFSNAPLQHSGGRELCEQCNLEGKGEEALHSVQYQLWAVWQRHLKPFELNRKLAHWWIKVNEMTPTALLNAHWPPPPPPPPVVTTWDMCGDGSDRREEKLGQRVRNVCDHRQWWPLTTQLQQTWIYAYRYLCKRVRYRLNYTAWNTLHTKGGKEGGRCLHVYPLHT